MELSPIWKDTFLQILREELIPAMGCTEPIAIAYGAARAREVLGCLPEEVLVEASGNLIKNVKSVIVPNTNGLSGIEAAVAAGLIAGKPEKRLEVISAVTDEEKRQIAAYLEKNCIQVRPAQSELTFDLLLTLRTAEHCVKLRIAENHTNIVLIEKDGVVLQRQDAAPSQPANLTDRSCLSVERILAFAEQVELEAVEPMIQRQLRMNLAIAEEGLRRDWGANIGSVLLRHNGDGVKNRAKAMAAAGSDARMSGCELPVCIVSGSGNQGITASVPVAVYAKELNVGEEKTIRSVLLSDLLTIHLKTGIGRLSAYCGAVSAGCAAGAAIAWLHGGGYAEIAHTLVNALAITSGIVCDGAKPSCAAKIATAVETGILGYEMYCDGQQFYSGEGLVGKGVERTIRNIGRLGREGMRATDEEILRIMTQCV